MSLKMWLTRSFGVSLLCAIGFTAMAFLVMGETNVAQFDREWISFIQGHETHMLTQIMSFFTFIGAGVPIMFITIVIVFVLYSVLHYRWELIFFLSVLLGSGLLNYALKLLFQRNRPTLHRIIEANGYSFPSGHSMAAFTLYGVLCYLLWKHVDRSVGRILLIILGSIMILCIGISRIYLGVHYPSDVVGGYLASGAWLAFSIGTYEHFLHMKTPKLR